jgi:TnpA family transposase
MRSFVSDIRTSGVKGPRPAASDSKKFGAWDQNLMTEWHVRYGGRGVMIYWHVEHKSTCIYSRLKAIHAQKLYRVEAGHPEEYPNL